MGCSTPRTLHYLQPSVHTCSKLRCPYLSLKPLTPPKFAREVRASRKKVGFEQRFLLFPLLNAYGHSFLSGFRGAGSEVLVMLVDVDREESSAAVMLSSWLSPDGHRGRLSWRSRGLWSASVSRSIMRALSPKPWCRSASHHGCRTSGSPRCCSGILLEIPRTSRMAASCS